MSFLKTTSEWKVLFSAAVGVAVLVSIWGIADNHNISFILELFSLLGIVSQQLAGFSGGGSTLGQTSFMGTYLLINAFFALYLMVKSAGRIRSVYGMALLLITLGIFLNPRGDAVKISYLFGIGFLALLYLAFCYRNNLLRRAGKAVLVLTALSAPLIGLLTFVEGSFVRNAVFRQSGLPGRVANWESALQALTERPLLGWGLENFEIALYLYYDPRVMLPLEYGYRAEPWHDRAHNVVIDYLTTTGILGTAIFFGLIACAVYVFWQKYLKAENNYFWTPAILTTLLVSHLLQNLTVFDMLSSYMLIFVVLAFAASQADSPSNAVTKLDQPMVAFSFKSYLLIVFLAVFVILSFNNFVYKPFRGGIYTVKAGQSIYENSLVDLYPLAIESSPLGQHKIRKHLAETTVKRLKSADNEAIKEIHFPEIEYMIEELKSSAIESPLHFRYVFSLGQTYNAYTHHLILLSAEEDFYEKAQEISLKAEAAFRKALILSPTNVQAYWGLAQALLNQGILFSQTDKFEKSLAQALEARDIEPRLFESHEIAVRIASGPMGDEILALTLVDQALKVNPEWEEPLMKHLAP